MGFAVSASEEILHERKVKGQYHKVAVDCWFTATGRMMPKMLKYMDDEGCLQTISNIHVKSREKKHYAGILNQMFKCNAVVCGRVCEFVLLFDPKEGVWDMVI